jgi:arsenate reductase
MIQKVLFLCTGNSARSILGESIVNHLGQGRFKGFSAGSHPRGRVHPDALELLASLNLPTEGLSSKSWDVFAGQGAPKMDFIFTVCDDAAGEACPVWPGHPVTAHWGIADPAAVAGEIDRRAAFRQAYAALENRIRLFLGLPLASLDRTALQHRLESIGRELRTSAA